MARVELKALVAQRIVDRVGSRSSITFVPYEEAYDEGFEELGKRRPDISALQELVGWRPRRSLDEALDDVIGFQRAELAMEATTHPTRQARGESLAVSGGAEGGRGEPR